MHNKKVLKEKHYAHFDKRISAKEMTAYVSNPYKVARHGFMPLIHFTRKDIKYTKINGRKTKLRDLCYVSHKDAYVYQWYANLINIHYNKRVSKDATNNCVIAYRNNKTGKFNAHFAKAAIDFIREKKSCYIIVGDFTGFFDNLDHSYLKERLCDLLQVERLTEDYWAVLKNVMKYSWFELDDLLKLNNLDNYKDINKLPAVLSTEQLHYSKEEYLRKNMNSYGIPQGTPISAVLSNVYMIEFDKKINDFITSAKGLYRRYSDDFIVVIPTENAIDKIWERISAIIKQTPNLKLQPLKTKLFKYDNEVLLNCNSKIFPTLNDSKNELEYLGFSFNGKKVSLRSKTISKFYYRAYHRVDNLILRENGIVNKKPDYYTLYKNYTHLGKSTKGKNRGNFLTYVDRCIEVFGEQEMVSQVRKRHWKRINDRIKKSINNSKCAS